MKRSTKIWLTVAFVPGMALLGLMTGLLLALVPGITGLAAALAVVASMVLSVSAGVLGAGAYCVGMALMLLVFQKELLPLAAWLLVFLLLALGLIRGQLRARTSVSRTMVYAGAGLFLFGMASYVACSLIWGDPVEYAAQLLTSELAAMERTMPQLYDLLLSMLSVSGVLPDVGLSQPVAALEAQTRRLLTANMIEVYDSSLRLSLMEILMQQVLHTAFLGTLLPLLLVRGKRGGEDYTALGELGMARLPVKSARMMLLAVIAAWVWMLLDTSAYAAYLAIWAAFKFIYAMQGLSVAEWFMKKHGWARVLRGIVLCIGFLFMQQLLFLLGIVEQMFYIRRIGRPDLRKFGVYYEDQCDEHGNPLPHDEENPDDHHDEN